MQTPNEFLESVNQAYRGITEPPIVKDIAELERAAVMVRPRIELLFKDFLPQIIAIAFIAFVVGGALGVSIGKHVH
jgi:hypothetical protein